MVYTDEAQIQYRIARLDELIAEGHERIKQNKMDIEQLEDLVEAISRLIDRMLDSADRSRHKLLRLLSVVSDKFMDAAIGVVTGTQFGAAQSSLASAKGTAQRKIEEVEQEIGMLQNQISGYQTEIQSLRNQLNNLRMEAMENADQIGYDR